MRLFETKRQKEERELLELMHEYGGEKESVPQQKYAELPAKTELPAKKEISVRNDGEGYERLLREILALREVVFQLYEVSLHGQEEEKNIVLPSEEKLNDLLLCRKCKKMVPTTHNRVEQRGKYTIQLGTCTVCGGSAFRMMKKNTV